MDEKVMHRMLSSVQRLPTALHECIKRTKVRIFKSSGEQTKQLKVWYGSVAAVDGVYTFNISSAKFTEILHIQPVVVHNDANFNNQVLVSINTQSLTQITGRVLSGGSSLVAGVGFTKRATATVMIKVEGF